MSNNTQVDWEESLTLSTILLSGCLVFGLIIMNVCGGYFHARPVRPFGGGADGQPQYFDKTGSTLLLGRFDYFQVSRFQGISSEIQAQRLTSVNLKSIRTRTLNRKRIRKRMWTLFEIEFEWKFRTNSNKFEKEFELNSKFQRNSKANSRKNLKKSSKMNSKKYPKKSSKMNSNKNLSEVISEFL